MTDGGWGSGQYWSVILTNGAFKYIVNEWQKKTTKFRCEVCEVSVNSSHQLQAHMTGNFPSIHIFSMLFCSAGHKHKMRCARQGVAPHRTILTPASSTTPSTTPSEASAPVRSHSVLVGRPQFGSRPNLCKTTSAATKNSLTR